MQPKIPDCPGAAGSSYEQSLRDPKARMLPTTITGAGGSSHGEWHAYLRAIRFRPCNRVSPWRKEPDPR